VLFGAHRVDGDGITRFANGDSKLLIVDVTTTPTCRVGARSR
jgi:hypothetical protein